MIFYDYLLTPQLFSYTAISRRNTVSCIKYQYRAALLLSVHFFSSHLGTLVLYLR